MVLLSDPHPASDPGTRRSRTIRLDLEYDGSDFIGWQIQARGRSVQGELARALGQLLQEKTIPVASGRTDAGTHALGQVAHFHTTTHHSAARLERALNSLLPPDIAVTAASEVSDSFHARYSATSKRYQYRIASAKRAVNRRQVWLLHGQLDLDAMMSASQALPGQHHFGAFCKQDPIPDRFECQILEAGWSRQDGEISFEIEANRFLRHMVRIIVGTLVEIGQGKRPPTDMASLLGGGSSARRSQAGRTAPAQGLCLLRVTYPGEGGLAAGSP